MDSSNKFQIGSKTSNLFTIVVLQMTISEKNLELAFPNSQT